MLQVTRLPKPFIHLCQSPDLLTSRRFCHNYFGFSHQFSKGCFCEIAQSTKFKLYAYWIISHHIVKIIIAVLCCLRSRKSTICLSMSVGALVQHSRSLSDGGCAKMQFQQGGHYDLKLSCP